MLCLVSIWELVGTGFRKDQTLIITCFDLNFFNHFLLFPSYILNFWLDHGWMIIPLGLFFDSIVCGAISAYWRAFQNKKSL